MHTRSTCQGPAHVSPLWPAQATPSAWTLASSQRGGRHWAPLSRVRPGPEAACRRCGPQGGSVAASPAGEGLVPMGRPWVPCLLLAWCPLPVPGPGLGAGASSDDEHELPELGTQSLPEPRVVPWHPGCVPLCSLLLLPQFPSLQLARRLLFGAPCAMGCPHRSPEWSRVSVAPGPLHLFPRGALMSLWLGL